MNTGNKTALTLLANLNEFRVSPKLSGSGAMLTNIKLQIKTSKISAKE